MANLPRVEITEKALKILKIESAILDLNQKEALESLILRGASPQTLAMLQENPLPPKLAISPKLELLEEMEESPIMKEKELPQEKPQIPQETRTALNLILEELRAGREPTVNMIADKLGLTPTGLGRVLSAVGIKSQNTHRDNKTVRIYTKPMIPQIEAILSKSQN